MRCFGSVVSCLCGERRHTKAAPTVATFRGRPLPYAGMELLSEADLETVEQRHFYRSGRLDAASWPGDDFESVGTASTNATTATSAGLLARQVVGAGQRCRHGWPQAIMYDPLYRDKAFDRHRLGDTTRLTCPLLVSAIDKLEKAGTMQRYNARLGPGGEWTEALAAVNEAHRQLRGHLCADRTAELSEVRAHLGNERFAHAMGAGLASMSPGSRDVKCLHAQVADELVRGGQNPIAQQTLRDIEEAGTQIDGTEECRDNCDVGVPLEQARWRLQKCKNNVGKRLSRGRRGAAGHRVRMTPTLHPTEEECERT